MKLLSTFLVLAVISVAGAAAALTFSPSGNSVDGSRAQICTLSGYMMYCN
jgi:hypothetical protein